MPSPRKKLISLTTTPYYHCVSRCVRRAYLCGNDKVSGKSFEHRRQWIEDRIHKLATVFSIDVCAFAVMSNHVHLVLHIDHNTVKQWSHHDVVARWHSLYKGSYLSQRYLEGDKLNNAEKFALNQLIQVWRERLCNISWFMKSLNEPIARQANREDNVTGRFWEGRFTSQALLDKKALIACLVYVDLNPIRAKIANTPEKSEHTSIQTRIQYAQQSQTPAKIHQQPKSLMPFVGWSRKDQPKGMPFRLQDYIELVDWSGRMIITNKRGNISANIPPILSRLKLDTKNWIYLTEHFESPFKRLVGSAHTIRQTCTSLGQRWAHGVSQGNTLFSKTFA